MHQGRELPARQGPGCLLSRLLLIFGPRGWVVVEVVVMVVEGAVGGGLQKTFVDVCTYSYFLSDWKIYVLFLLKSFVEFNLRPAECGLSLPVNISGTPTA